MFEQYLPLIFCSPDAFVNNREYRTFNTVSTGVCCFSDTADTLYWAFITFEVISAFNLYVESGKLDRPLVYLANGLCVQSSLKCIHASFKACWQWHA